jgi:malate dehydrogenase (oxaloacetate-decarboxylating)
VAAGALLSDVNITGIPLTEHRIGIVGFGTAGIGIAGLLVSLIQYAGLSEQQARASFYALDRHGLLVEGMKDLRSEQQPFVRNVVTSKIGRSRTNRRSVYSTSLEMQNRPC